MEKYNVIKWNIKILATLLLITPLLISCNSDEKAEPSQKAGNIDPVFACETDSNNPLVGCWTSEQCYKTNSVPIYTEHEKYTYAYLKSGHVFVLIREWNNSDCSGEVSRYRLLNPYEFNFTSETLTTNEGIIADIHEVDYSETSEDTHFVAYSIQSDRVCMTPGVLGEFGEYRYTSIGDLPTTIDYEICLIKDYVEYNE